MSRSQLKYWPVLYGLDEEFIATIKMVLVYGLHANEALIVLKDDSVHEVGTTAVRDSNGKSLRTFFKPAKVDELSNKGVKEFVWGCKYGVAALTDKGEVYYWNQKEPEAQCSRVVARPILIDGCFCGKSIVQISCSDSCLFALTDDGRVFRHDGFSPSNMIQSLCPQLTSPGPVKYIACSSDRVNILDARGELHICGMARITNHKGCGHSHYDHEFISSLLKIVIVKVVCGHSHTLALSENGDVYGWGENSYGQLGIGTTSTSTTAGKVTSKEMGKVADIAAIRTDHISAALTCTGQVFVWGRSRGLQFPSPIVTPFSTLHEVLGTSAESNIMHAPLILHDEEKEAEMDVIGSLREAFDNPSNSDFAIKVEGKPIHVHKSVLGIRSLYFQTMFKEQWTENNQSAIEHNDFSYDVYKSFLTYLYTGEIDLQEKKLIELLALANAYCELQLKRRCAQILGKDIRVSNVSRLYDVAVTHESKELCDLCVKFASNHISVIVLSPEFSELGGETAKAFMIKAMAMSVKTERVE